MTTHTDFSPLDKTNWLITSVPLHPRRYRWRGFNQSALLAQALAAYTHRPLPRPFTQTPPLHPTSNETQP